MTHGALSVHRCPDPTIHPVEALGARWFRRNSEQKVRSFSNLGLHPDGSSIPLHNPAADRQAHSRAGILHIVVKPSENSENLLVILARYTDSVVQNRIDAIAVPDSGADVNLRNPLSAIFDCIANQIFEKAAEDVPLSYAPAASNHE